MSARLRLPMCNLIKTAESAINEASTIEMVMQVAQTSAGIIRSISVQQLL